MTADSRTLASAQNPHVLLESVAQTETGSEMLLELGVPIRQAARHARSRKGPWHMAKTIASGVGMTNAWLQGQGVLSLKSLWSELAQLR